MPSDVAKRIAENIETHREIMRSNGAKENPAVIQAIIDAELKAERDAAKKMEQYIEDDIDSHPKTRRKIIAAYRKARGGE